MSLLTSNKPFDPGKESITPSRLRLPPSNPSSLGFKLFTIPTAVYNKHIQSPNSATYPSTVVIQDRSEKSLQPVNRDSYCS